jgi:hypothetical protein
VSQIEEYQKSIDELNKARAEVDRLTRTAIEIADKLRNWRVVMLSNLADVNFHFSIALDASKPSIDCRDWPSPIALRDAMNHFYASRATVMQAWKLIPEGKRTGLTPPESM